MSKGKRNVFAVLLTAILAFIFAALLCLGFPVAEAHAEGTTHTVSSQEELENAFKKAQDGDTIILDANIELSQYILINYNPSTNGSGSLNGGITLDLNGKTISLTETFTSEFARADGKVAGGVAIRVYGDITLTVTGNGTFNGSAATNADGKATEINLFSVQSGATLQIESGNYIVNDDSGACVYAFADSHVVINGGTFQNKSVEDYPYADGGLPLVVNQANVSEQLVTINGGTFKGRNPILGDDNVGGTFVGDKVNMARTSNGDYVAYKGGSVPESASVTYTYSRETGVTATVYDADGLTEAVAQDCSTVVLGADITQSITVSAGRELTLDLNGHTMTNTAGSHTITNYGKLTIVDGSLEKNGTVDNISHAHGALVNYGEATVSGGTFTRSKEAGISSDNNGGNSWYTLKNYGLLTIEEGTTVTTRMDNGGQRVGAHSSLIANGYQNNSDYTNNHDQVTAGVGDNAMLIIEGGTFRGGINAIKNDEGGIAEIAGGAFTNVTQAAVQNWNDLTISGGTFNTKDDSAYAVVSGRYTSEIGSIGDTTITGGTFNGAIVADGTYGADVTYVVSGGKFSTMPKAKYFAEGYIADGNDFGVYTVKAGTFEIEVGEYKFVGNDLRQAIQFAQDGDTVKLLGDIKATMSATTVKAEITIDLNDKTVTAANDMLYILDLKAEKDITIKNGRLAGKGIKVVAAAEGVNISISGINIERLNEKYPDESDNMYKGVTPPVLVVGSSSSQYVTNATLEDVEVNVYVDATGSNGRKAVEIYNADVTIENSSVFADSKEGIVINGIAIENSDVVVTGSEIVSTTGSAVGFLGALSFEASVTENTENFKTLTVENSELTGHTIALSGDGGAGNSGTVINIVNSQLNSTGKIGPAIYQPQYGIINISGEKTVIKGSSGIEIRAGIANISGGAFTADAETFSAEANGNGTTTDGAAVAVVQHTTKLPVQVNITGGTFKTETEDGKALYQANLQKNDSEAVAKIAMAVSGGTYNGEVSSENLTGFISGGQFGGKVDADYLAEDCAQIASGKTFIVGTEANLADSQNAVAKIEETGVAYTTLQAAINAAADGETIRLLTIIGEETDWKSVDESPNLQFYETGGKSVTIDFGGHAVYSGAKTYLAAFAGTLTLTNGSLYVYGTGVQITAVSPEVLTKVILTDSFSIDSYNQSAVFITTKDNTNYDNLVAELETSAELTSWNTSNNTSQECWATIQGNGEQHGTKIIINGGSVVNKKDVAIYHPQYGTLNVNGGVIYGETTGIEMRAGLLIVNNGKITGNGDPFASSPNGNGSTTVGAAVAVSQHSTNLTLNATITGGELNGVRSLYEEDMQNDSSEGISLSVTGGTYNGEVFSENLTGFISGGQFAMQPTEDYMDPDYIAEFHDGYFVPVESSALRAAQANAQADVREYAATLGITWSDVVTAASDSASANYATAIVVINLYNAIAETTSEKGVAEARLDVMDAVDAYIAAEADAFAQYKAKRISDKLNPALEGKEGTDDDVVLPTATWFALNHAATQEEFEEYLANAVAEVKAIRSLRTEISKQTEDLTTLMGILSLSDSAETETLLDKIQEAIDTSVVGVGENPDPDTLAGIYNYLSKIIEQTLDKLAKDFDSLSQTLTAYKTTLDKMYVVLLGTDENGTNSLLKQIQEELEELRGEGDVNTIAGAVTEINRKTEKLIQGLKKDLIGENGTGGVLGTIAGYVDQLEGMLGSETSGLGAIVADIEEAKDAIMGVTEADEDGVNLSEVLTEVGKANAAVESALTKMNETLAAWQQTVAGYEGTLAGLETALGDGEGSLYDRIDSAITAAQDAITGSTDGVGGASISSAFESLSGELETVQQAILSAMPDYSQQLTAISGSIEALQTLLNGNSGLAAIKTELDSVVSAIGSATSGDTSASGLFALLEAIQSGNSSISSAVTALQNALLGTDNNGAIANLTNALETAQDDLDSLTGALLEANGGLSTDITDAFAEIDRIVAAIGSLGTAEGSDLATQIGGIVDSLEEVQGTVGSIAESVDASTTVETAKETAFADVETWINAYLDNILAVDGEAGSAVAALAYTAETTEGDIYAKLAQAFSEDNAKLVLRYYNDALAAIDAATTVSEVTTAVSTFKAQVASVEAAAQNVTDVDLTGVYVLLAVAIVLIVAAVVVLLLKGRKESASAVQTAENRVAQPEEAPAAEAPVQAETETEPSAEEELAAEDAADDDKDRIVIAANVRSFSEAYMDLDEKQRELFTKVKDYALAKEGAVEVSLNSGVCIKREGKQIVKLTVRRNLPVALFLLENEMLKDFRRSVKSETKLKVRATELAIRDEEDLQTAYTMVDLSIDQIEKDIEAAKERRREARRQRRLQRQAEKEQAQSEEAGAAESLPSGTEADDEE